MLSVKIICKSFEGIRCKHNILKDYTNLCLLIKERDVTAPQFIKSNVVKLSRTISDTMLEDAVKHSKE